MDPMLARLARDLPDGEGWVFEPKWDGFRGLAFCAGDDVDLRSRHQRPLARYPELVAALRPLGRPGAVVDRFAAVLGLGQALPEGRPAGGSARQSP